EPLEAALALRDIANPQMLKHVANHEQRLVSHNMQNPAAMKAENIAPIPAGLSTRPQIASARLTQEADTAQYSEHAITVKIQDYGDTAYGWAMEDSDGFVKLIAEKATGQILGVHILGLEATNLIQPVLTAMSMDIPAHQLARGQYWIHPAMAEVVENALLGLDVPDSGCL